LHESSIVKNLDVSNGGGVAMDFDSLVDMPSLQDVFCNILSGYY